MSKRKEPDWTSLLEEGFKRWDHMRIFGGQDPAWADGVNLNLLRNHIIYYKGKLMETAPDSLPDIYYRDTPPEVDPNYMARRDEIRDQAIKTFHLLKNAPDYQYLLSMARELDDKQKSLLWPIRQVSQLKMAISENDYVTMRRFKNSASMLDSIAKTAEAVRKVPLKPRQLTLEDLIAR